MLFGYEGLLTEGPFARTGVDSGYGSGLAVVLPETRGVIWVYIQSGDFGPHTPGWADFDGDGRPDLFFLAGFEDVFATHLYLNRVATQEFEPNNFALAYSNDDSYAVPLDFDGDSIPELLVPEPQVFEPDTQECDSAFYFLFQEVAIEIAAEYRRLAGPLERLHFTYGSSGYPVTNMFMDERVRSFSVLEGRLAAMTHPEHLQWRLDLLNRVRDQVPGECLERFDATRTYLSGLLEGQ